MDTYPDSIFIDYERIHYDEIAQGDEMAVETPIYWLPIPEISQE